MLALLAARFGARRCIGGLCLTRSRLFLSEKLIALMNDERNVRGASRRES